MLKIAFAVLVILVAAVMARAGDAYIPSSLGLSDECVQQLRLEMHARCQLDSGGNCQEFTTVGDANQLVKKNSDNQALFEYGFIGEHHDEYHYFVHFLDKEYCEYTARLQ